RVYYEHSSPVARRSRHDYAAAHHPPRPRRGLVAPASRGSRLRPRPRRDARPAHPRREHRHGAPAVMLHGFPEHWWQWHEVAPAVAAAGYRVLCPDLRGAGWTTADDPRIDRETRLRDLLALLDALGVERAHLVSHDMGVITAMQLTYDHPERVRTAVQLSVPPGFFRFTPRLAPAFEHLPPLIWHRRGAALRGIFAPGSAACSRSAESVDAHLAPSARAEIVAAVRPLTRRMGVAEALRMMRGVYRRQRLTVPTLVVYGRQDLPTTEELMHRICPDPDRYADRLELAWVDDAAHFITDDAPADVAALTVDWFRRAA